MRSRNSKVADARSTRETSSSSSSRTAAAYPAPHSTVKIRSGAFGLGLYSTAEFDKCEVILAEKPIFTAPRAADKGLLVNKARSLSHEHLVRLLSFEAGCDAGTRGISAIFFANAIPCVEDEAENLTSEERGHIPCGVFRYSSRINHSCSPNAGWFWSSKSQRLRKLGRICSSAYASPDC